MSKKRFVQAVVIRRLPAVTELLQTIQYAEQLWKTLTQHGFGDDQPGDPRESKNWYAELNANQANAFNAFWIAFDLKKGRNGAAMRWYQLGELSKAEYQSIIDAAKAEVKKPIPQGQARKWAQGWLQEKRWLDHVQPAADTGKAKALEFNRLSNELAGLRSLYNASANEGLLQQINALETKLKEVRDGR